MNAQQTAKMLAQKYNTTDPVALAEALDIFVLYEPLGSIKGYYNIAFRQKFIHINENLSARDKLFTAAHELGHAILHPNANTPFLRMHTHFSVERLELDANRFAVHLLMPEQELQEYLSFGYNTEQIAMCYGCHPALVELRLQTK